jgi:ketosteroid isomerase-like protein
MTTVTQASTAAVAAELVELCREGKNMEAIDRLYSQSIVSIEPMGSETMPAEMKGIDAIRGKNQWWFDNFEVNSHEVEGPFVGEEQFAVHYRSDVTFTPTGERHRLNEMALYTVADGKIVREEFFYHMPGK